MYFTTLLACFWNANQAVINYMNIEHDHMNIEHKKLIDWFTANKLCL